MKNIHTNCFTIMRCYNDEIVLISSSFVKILKSQNKIWMLSFNRLIAWDSWFLPWDYWGTPILL